MLALDLRSLSAMSGLMAVVLGLVLFGVRANFPESIRGLRLWGLAPLLCASSTVLFVLTTACCLPGHWCWAVTAC